MVAVAALRGGCGEAAEKTPAAESTPAEGYASQYDAVDRRLCVEDDETRAYCECVFDYMAERVPYDEFAAVEKCS